MCRWLAYSGSPIYLEDLVLKPEHSLIDQSLEARSGATTTNGDGFGVGWYGGREAPGVYRDVHPAWNDRNLRDLAAQIKSPLFLAHVRAATGTPAQQTNCHPFRFGNWLFVHNGSIREFSRIKRQLALAVDPKLYPEIRGSTDSEIMFFLAVTYGLAEDPFAAAERMAGLVERVGHEHGIEQPLQMTLGMSDGRRLVAVRYSSQRRSRTLFLSRSVACFRELHPDLDHFSDDARAIVSEPLNDFSGLWQEIPESTAVIVEAGEVVTRPFEPRLPD